ncbi:hypothetical protein FACS1894110_10200 [Spirochaetia bacterium]|nr:hypothetical protein FACS1894110_10200 [Spirochaetia bacterium]
MSHFSDALTTWRVNMGLTFRQLSELSGMTPMEISQLENAKRLPSGYDMDRLKKPLGTTLDDFFRELVKDHETCTWKYFEEGVWHTDCDNAFCFIDLGPKENHMKFCPYCGKLLEEVK